MSGTLEPVTPPPGPVVVETKPWWMSVTIWINVLGLLAAFLAGFAELDFIKSIPNLQNWIIGLLGVINLILRIFTTIAPVTIMNKVMAFKDVKKYGGGPTHPL